MRAKIILISEDQAEFDILEQLPADGVLTVGELLLMIAPHVNIALAKLNPTIYKVHDPLTIPSAEKRYYLPELPNPKLEWGKS